MNDIFANKQSKTFKVKNEEMKEYLLLTYKKKCNSIYKKSVYVTIVEEDEVDYKALYEQQKQENEELKKQLKKNAKETIEEHLSKSNKEDDDEVIEPVVRRKKAMKIKTKKEEETYHKQSGIESEEGLLECLDELDEILLS